MNDRKRLHAVKPQPRPEVPYSLLRQAVRLFRSDMAPKTVRRANARKWLRAVLMLGDKHLYRGGEARWGHCKGAK